MPQQLDFSFSNYAELKEQLEKLSEEELSQPVRFRVPSLYADTEVYSVVEIVTDDEGLALA
jgi:hypothetical protein